MLILIIVCTMSTITQGNCQEENANQGGYDYGGYDYGNSQQGENQNYANNNGGYDYGKGNYDYGNGSYDYGNGNYNYGNGNGSYDYGNYNYGNGSQDYGNYNYGGNGSYDYGNYGDPNVEQPSQEASPANAKFTECGGQLTESTALLKTPHYPTEENTQSVYPNSAYCKWWYTGNETSLVRFKMWDLVIEIGENDSNITCDFDYINITITSIGSKRFCGYETPEEEYRGMGSFTMIFVSDATTNFRGMQGTYQITENHTPCDPSPCSQYGECEILPDLVRVKCNCEDGFTGRKCDTDVQECNSSPCQNGGTCNDKIKINHYECNCAVGYKGINCETKIQDPCLPNPCKNEGICRKHSNTTYSCDCTDLYKGDACEIENFPPCHSSPCKNGGVCLDFKEETKYISIPNYEGSSSPGESLQKKAPAEYFGFNCTCDWKHRGKHCEINSGCGNPGIPGLEDGYWFDPNSTVEFSCVEGYDLVGKANSTCHADGTWSSLMPDCVENPEMAASKQKGPVTPWSGAMMALGAAFIANAIAFASWMAIKAPWKKAGRIINISQASLKSLDEVDQESQYSDEDESDDDDESDDTTSAASQSCSESGSSDGDSQ
uniref:fibropellin-3-like isoform X1 n=1 Tax=Styela clava TaxID=7725 RepID=UPI00193A33C1|nr:fibropellin-3-like isoform X1 [Styela clava]